MTWCKYHEDLLKKWAEMCKTYSIMHSKSTTHFNKWKNRLGIPPIIIGATASVLNFVNTNLENPILNYVAGGLAFLVTAMVGINEFIDAPGKMIDHNSATKKYKEISMEIDKVLSFPRKERPISSEKFLNKIKKQIVDIMDISPTIPSDIVNHHIKFRHIKPNTRVNHKECYIHCTPDTSNNSDVIINVEEGEEIAVINDFNGPEVENILQINNNVRDDDSDTDGEEDGEEDGEK